MRGPAPPHLAAEAIRAGADQATMLGAVFLCGVRDHLANPADAETEVYRRSLHTLEKAGIHPPGGSR